MACIINYNINSRYCDSKGCVCLSQVSPRSSNPPQQAVHVWRGTLKVVFVCHMYRHEVAIHHNKLFMFGGVL